MPWRIVVYKVMEERATVEADGEGEADEDRERQVVLKQLAHGLYLCWRPGSNEPLPSRPARCTPAHRSSSLSAIPQGSTNRVIRGWTM